MFKNKTNSKVRCSSSAKGGTTETPPPPAGSAGAQDSPDRKTCCMSVHDIIRLACSARAAVFLWIRYQFFYQRPSTEQSSRLSSALTIDGSSRTRRRSPVPCVAVDGWSATPQRFEIVHVCMASALACADDESRRCLVCISMARLPSLARVVEVRAATSLPSSSRFLVNLTVYLSLIYNMANTLERVLTVHQTSMGATRLPLELQQQVFSYLDTKSFYTARNVCKWWRFASVDAVTLARQLKKLPILPPADAASASPHELQRLFDEAAYTLMLGVQVRRQPDERGTFSSAQRSGCLGGPRVTAVSNGNCTVTINDRMIAEFDTSGSKARLLAQRPLNDLKETVGSGPWLKVSPTSHHELALSSDGSLLAIAQERTIQIYDLSAEPDSFTVNEYISSAAGHYICGLDFEQDDRVLRVRLSGKGAVLYLGTPPAVDRTGSERLTIDHWKSKAGLKHVFLDSTLLKAITQTAGVADTTARIAGLHLLRPFHDGYLFAAQKHGGNESSHYILGHVRCSTSATALTAEPQSLTILTRLEGFLSAWDYTLNGMNESGMGLWENMPSAHEHHPSFAMSPDGTMLVLAERDKKRIRPVPLSQLFVYRLPSERRLTRTIEEAQQRRSGKWATLSGFLDKLEQRKNPHTANNDSTMSDGQTGVVKKHNVGRIPLCLSTIQGAVTELKLEDVVTEQGGQAVVLSAATGESTERWTLSEMAV